jgi:hypothetical protein
VQSKIDLYVNRYQLVLQRLRRNRLFRAADFAAQLDPARAQVECEVSSLGGGGHKMLGSFTRKVLNRGKKLYNGRSWGLTSFWDP